MKFENLTEEQKNVLINIQKSIPTEWTSTVTKREALAPTIIETLKLALTDPDVSPETKAEAKALLDSGYLNKEIDVEQVEVAELINAYVEKEIIKAVVLKKLPPLKKRRSFEAANKRFNQLLKKHEARSNK
jgi:hypothetical protein